MGRNDFASLLANENNTRKTFTENGAVAYATSGKRLLDFNFKLSQYRNMYTEDIKDDFTKVFFEDPIVATKFVFYVGDIRGGLGERKVFNTCIEWLADNKPEVALAVIKFIPEYTRWDNLIRLMDNKNVSKEVFRIIKEQLRSDMINMKKRKNISLCAKWMPSINASSVDTRKLANKICTRLGATPREYRKMLSSLRKYLDVVEVKMSSNDWGSIDYTAVPSQANLKYNNAFLKQDTDRRRAYLSSLQKGETKINASVAQPHEIVRQYNMEYGSKGLDVALEEMWKALPDICIENSLVVRDGSGSMCSRVGNGKTSCLDVATALAIYCAEHNSEEWKDKFITFSSHPSFVDLSHCKTLRDKLIRCYKESDCSNTDIEATMRLILHTAIRNHCSQEDMPKNIIIISDMQFDGSSSYGRYSWNSGMNWNPSLFEEISKEYARYGYKLPRICFWNVCSRNFDTIPMQRNELGLVLCSGFSTTNMRMFMSGKFDPYEILLEQINNKRYDIIEESIRNII